MLELTATPFRRLFIAVPLAETAKIELKKNLHHLPGKQVSEEKWHFTLEFLGNVEETRVEALYKLFNEILLPPAFEVSMNSMGAFPKPKAARILWVGIEEENNAFNNLSHLFKEALALANFTVDTRPFIPHLTVSRFFRPTNVIPWLTGHSFQPVKTNVNKVVLIQSNLSNNQSHYESLLSRELTDGAQKIHN